MIKYISCQMVFAYMAVWSVSKSRKVGIVDYANKSKINRAEPLIIKAGIQFSNVFEVQG